MIDYSNIPRDSRRVPLETRVQFKFDRFSGFISEHSANISPSGMFLRTSAPQPPGTELDLEFRLGDGFELIKGRGEVIWVRAQDEGPGRPAGMGLRFVELSEGSKELIYRIVDEHILQGGTPFDVTQRPPDPTPTRGREAEPAPLSSLFDLPPSPQLRDVEPAPGLLPRQAADAPPAVAPPMFATSFAGVSSEESPRRVLPWVLLVAGLALAGGVFLLWDRLAELTEPGGEAETSEATMPAPPAGPAASTSTLTPPVVTVPPVTPPSQADPGPPLTRLERVTWERVAGGTDVVLWGNGAIPASVFQRARIEGNPPRELIRLSGIRSPCPQTRLVAGTAELLQIRLGYHPEAGSGEQHVVLDLAHPAVVITEIEPGPRRLRLHLQRR
jgi:uncharacterized protein (TIGR02266 family)